MQAHQVATPRIGRILGGDARLAANDEGDLTTADLEAIDAQFPRTAAQAIEQSRAIERQVMHEVTRSRDGFGLDAKITLACKCGWKFTADEADDYAYSKLSAQQAQHMRGGVL